jgi:hypothetical protein
MPQQLFPVNFFHFRHIYRGIARRLLAFTLQGWEYKIGVFERSLLGTASHLRRATKVMQVDGMVRAHI